MTPQPLDWNTTGSRSMTVYVSEDRWEGHKVMVSGSEPVCTPGLHDLRPVLHDGEPGTGFLMCRECQGICAEPEESS